MAVSELSELKPVYLIYGGEELLLERAVKRLRERIAAVADLDFNLETFDGESSTADEILTAANTMPFLSEKRLVIVRDVERLSPSDAAAIAEYAADPAPYTALVLVASKVNKSSKLYKAVAKLGGAFEYEAPKRYQYPAEVVRMFADRGKKADKSAAEYLVEAVGRDLRRLDTEVGKVCAYVGEREEVTLEDARTVTEPGVVPSVFELLDALGARDAGAAVAKLRAMLRAGESAIGIHAMCVRHVRALIGAKALLERNARVQEMAPALGMAPWQAEKALRQAQAFEAAELRHMLASAAEVELQMKTSPVDAGLVLERWVIEACG